MCVYDVYGVGLGCARVCIHRKWEVGVRKRAVGVVSRFCFDGGEEAAAV